MKTYLTKTKFVAVALATLFMTGTAVPAFAGNDDDKKAEVSYVGNLNELPVFRLTLNNKVKEAYYVSVTDIDGNILHSEKVNGTNIVRNYQFNGELYGNYNLTFTITDAKGKEVSTYNVNKNKKTVDEITVNEVK
ncbi:MAG TPA: hypothetical protein PLS07_04485 [Niabella sp.]|nr:hypothetical protein [Niabella sp.]HQW14226.1 hypothetical protein [Niabella sp.]HQX19626.1 hypothetical protein [Niabella sp.]HQX39940.1 hypothetical protein [Niabella sp.]HRB06933.1 hypothetical protein [Niabella sp.]